MRPGRTKRCLVEQRLLLQGFLAGIRPSGGDALILWDLITTGLNFIRAYSALNPTVDRVALRRRCSKKCAARGESREEGVVRRFPARR